MSSKDTKENTEKSSPSEDSQYADGGNMCLELALEGERLCKAGDCRSGVAFFQAAIQAGTDDLRTLSAIYSQLGNAYFYLGDYAKAMQYHKHDLSLARSMNDQLGEAKSSGNLGNALKVMGKFDEAIVCCRRHLEISRQLKDKLCEGRALYNLGNVFHTKAKHLGRAGLQDPSEYTDEIKSCLKLAIQYYEDNLLLMKELGDVAAQGRACGNLGNTNYLLGQYPEAIRYHEERLKIACDFGDKSAERRAHSNLGNTHIFMGEFEQAAEHYKKTLSLAQELQEKAIEAQACYSLGNTYTLLHNYTTAIEYHLRHYLIAQQLQDRIGEGRACWSLGNAYSSLEDHEKALRFAEEHLIISKELGDSLGQATALVNIRELKKILGMELSDLSPESEELLASASPSGADDSSAKPPSGIRRYRVRRKSMEQLDLIKLTPDGKHGASKSSRSKSPSNPLVANKEQENLREELEQEQFFDYLSGIQANRMDEQRCPLGGKNGGRGPRPANIPANPPRRHVQEPPRPAPPTNVTEEGESFLDMILGIQGRRMNEQRAVLPGAAPAAATELRGRRDLIPEDEDDRTKSATVPDEDFFSHIMRLQSGRMDDQRANLNK